MLNEILFFFQIFENLSPQFSTIERLKDHPYLVPPKKFQGKFLPSSFIIKTMVLNSSCNLNESRTKCAANVLPNYCSLQLAPFSLQ